MAFCERVLAVRTPFIHYAKSEFSLPCVNLSGTIPKQRAHTLFDESRVLGIMTE